MISESYKNRIQELAGVLLEDNSGKLKGFGINDQVASYLVKLDDKLSIFVANITLAEFAKEEGIEGENLKELIPIINQNDYLNFLERNEGRINYVLEWVKSPDKGEINLRDIKDLSQAMEMAEAWHNAAPATGAIHDESGEIVKTYPKEGYYWIDLKTNSSRPEADAMGHCGTDSRATTLFSFRDKEKSPHVTIAYDANNKSLRQVKGRANKRPLPEYMKYVYDFLREMVNQGMLTDVGWSYGKDLEDDEINFIFEGKKDVLILSILEKNLKQNTYFQPPFTKEEIIAAIGKDKYKEYINKLLQKSLEIPSFNPKLKKGDIVDTIGLEGFNQYVKELFEKAIVNNQYQIGLSRNEIVRVVGEEQYNRYVHSILDKVLKDPVHQVTNMTKDELFAMLGDVGYKNYMKTLITNILESRDVNSENSLTYVLRKHGIPFEQEKLKAIAGPRAWFQYIKRLAMRGQSNIGAGIWE